MDLIKNTLQYLWDLLEDFGRARAAAALARDGKHELAREIISKSKC